MTKTKAQRAADDLDVDSTERVAVKYEDGRIRRVDPVSAKSLLSKGKVELADVPEEDPAEAPTVVLDGRTE